VATTLRAKTDELRSFLDVHINSVRDQLEGAHVQFAIGEFKREPMAGDQQASFPRTSNRCPHPLKLFQGGAGGWIGRGR
jgi:hypothetical protein